MGLESCRPPSSDVADYSYRRLSWNTEGACVGPAYAGGRDGRLREAPGREGVDSPDHDGTELPGINEAREAVVVAAGEEIRDFGRRFWDGGQEWQMNVTDESGATVCK